MLHTRVSSYSEVGAVEQRHMVNSGVRATKQERRPTPGPGLVVSNTKTIMFKCLVPVNYSTVMVLAETLSFRARRCCFLGPLRTRAGSTAHHTTQEPA
jgi:hypothetical protein